MQTMYSFDDVLIVPKMSDIKSRADVKLTSMFLGVNLELPIISSNMDTVTGVKMARAMNDAGAWSCLHRFWSIEDNVKAFEEAFSERGVDSIVSVGIGDKELERTKALFDAGATHFCIDVAHGASQAVVEQAVNVRKIIGSSCYLIVGNFATAETIIQFAELSNKAADAYKVGIGGGSACTTRVVTGVGIPTFSSIVDCVRSGYPIIGDGGCRTSGDIAKALGAGAKAVFLGQMLAGTDEAPGESVYKRELITDRWGVPKENNVLVGKKYRGSASAESYEVQGKTASWRSAEGEAFVVPYKGPVLNIIGQIEGGIRSALSYVGASNLGEFSKKVQFVAVTGNGTKESSAHGRSVN